MRLLRVPTPFPGQLSRRGPQRRKTPPFPVSNQADYGRRKRGRPVKTININSLGCYRGPGTEGWVVLRPWPGDRQAQVSPRAEFYGPEQQQLRHLRHLAERPGGPPPASAALGQSLRGPGGEETPPSRQEKPAASAFLCVPQALSLQPSVSRASDPRSGFWRQLAGGAGCTLTARDPSLSSRELQLPGVPRELRPRCGDLVRWPFFPAGPFPPLRSPHC